jgi:hypothetical protein
MMIWDGWQINCNDLCLGTVLSYHLLGGTEEVRMNFSGWPSYVNQRSDHGLPNYKIGEVITDLVVLKCMNENRMKWV